VSERAAQQAMFMLHTFVAASWLVACFLSASSARPDRHDARAVTAVNGCRDRSPTIANAPATA